MNGIVAVIAIGLIVILAVLALWVYRAFRFLAFLTAAAGVHKALRKARFAADNTYAR